MEDEIQEEFGRVPSGFFLWALSDTAHNTRETCSHWGEWSFDYLFNEASDFIMRQLDELYDWYPEYFNLAEYHVPEMLEMMERSEVVAFLAGGNTTFEEPPAFRSPGGDKGHGSSGTGDATGGGWDFDRASLSIKDCDEFDGLEAVIQLRLAKRTPEGLRSAAELFNWTIDNAFGLEDLRVETVLHAGTFVEVAPYVLRRILRRLVTNATCFQVPTGGGHSANYAKQPALDPFERTFLPFLPVLTALDVTLKDRLWIDNPLAIEVMSWVLRTYNSVLKAEI